MTMPIPADERRAALRQYTHDLHVELDALATSLDLRCRDDYCHYLLAISVPVIGLELALEASGVETVFGDWPVRRRRFALASDLHALGLAAASCADRRYLTTSEMFGTLYVLEGSRMGAQMLLRRVNQSTDDSVRAARHFLSLHQSTLWSTFLHALATTHEAIDDDEMLEAACDTFREFKTSFTARIAGRQAGLETASA